MVLFFAILAILVVIGVYVSKRIMGMAKEEEPSAVSHSMLTEIKKAYETGEISAEEYARIRTRLVSAIRNETLGEKRSENEEIVIFGEEKIKYR